MRYRVYEVTFDTRDKNTHERYRMAEMVSIVARNATEAIQGAFQRATQATATEAKWAIATERR